jgi:heat shock protein beta
MRTVAILLCIAGSFWSGQARAIDIDTDGDSIPDEDEVGDFDGDNIPDFEDTDDDNDLVATLLERQRAPQSGDTDGDFAPDHLDTDDDNDGLLTMLELGGGGGVAPRDTDHDGKLDYLDADDDGDGEPTAVERQFAPPEPDVNHNNIPDYLDAAAFGSQAGANPDEGDTCGVPSVNDAGLPVCWDQDHDGDGIWSAFEGSPTFTLDNDGDGKPDFLDADDDGDGVPTANESADPNHDGNPDDARDTSGNNPDYLNRDDDDDTIPTIDERPGNKDRDTDLDGRPNQLDDDDDGDRLSTSVETSGPDGVNTDTNNNGIPAYLDPDEKYQPPNVTVDAGALTDDAGVPIASLDGGLVSSKDAGSSTRRDGGATAASGGTGSDTDAGADEENPDDTMDPDVPAGHKGSGGCGVVAARQEGVALGALSSLLLACALFVRRARPR